MLAVKYNTVDGVGILTASHSVENYVSHGHFTEKGFIACFGIDYSCQPINIVLVVDLGGPFSTLTRGVELYRTILGIPFEIEGKGFGHGAYGHVNASVNIENVTYSIEITSIYRYVAFSGAGRQIDTVIFGNSRA